MGTRRYNKNTAYNYGSTATDIYHDVYVLPVADKQAGLRLRQERKQSKIRILKRRLFYIVNILILFVASGAFVWQCSIVSSKQYDLKQAKAEVRDLKSQVNTKKALIASAINLDHIKHRAINELHMAEPLPHQIVYIHVQKTSYTMVDKDLKDKDKGW